MDELEHVMLREKSQLRKARCSVIPSIGKVQNWQIRRHGTQTGGCRKLGTGRMGSWLLSRFGASVQGNEKLLELDRDDGCTTTRMLRNATELNTLKWLKWLSCM